MNSGKDAEPKPAWRENPADLATRLLALSEPAIAGSVRSMNALRPSWGDGDEIDEGTAKMTELQELTHGAALLWPLEPEWQEKLNSFH